MYDNSMSSFNAEYEIRHPSSEVHHSLVKNHTSSISCNHDKQQQNLPDEDKKR